MTKILESKDYGKFHFFTGEEGERALARPISESHVQELAELIREDGFLDAFPCRVVWFNGELYVAGGNHRFLAAKILNIPVKYVLDEKKYVGVEGAREILNMMYKEGTSFKNWPGRQYVLSSTSPLLNMPDYVALQDCMDRHKISYVAMMNILDYFLEVVGGNRVVARKYPKQNKEGKLGMSYSRELAKVVTSGKFVFLPYRAMCENKLQEIEDIRSFALKTLSPKTKKTPFIYQPACSTALVLFTTTTNYDHTKMLRKLRLVGNRFIRQPGGAKKDYLDCLTGIYIWKDHQ